MTDGTPAQQERSVASPPLCDICEGEIDVPGDVMEHELVVCTDCGTEYEVADTGPLSLTQAPTAGEDWGE